MGKYGPMRTTTSPDRASDRGWVSFVGAGGSTWIPGWTIDGELVPKAGGYIVTDLWLDACPVEFISGRPRSRAPFLAFIAQKAVHPARTPSESYTELSGDPSRRRRSDETPPGTVGGTSFPGNPSWRAPAMDDKPENWRGPQVEEFGDDPRRPAGGTISRRGRVPARCECWRAGGSVGIRAA